MTTTRPGGDRSPLAGRGLHFRRLISFLRRRRLYATARALGREARVFFDAAHLRRMILHDRWAAASSYTLRFLNLRDCSREAGMLHRYIVVFRVIADPAAGHTLTRAVDALFQQLYDSLLALPDCHITRRVVLSWRTDHTKASRLYQNNKRKAVDAIMNLVANCPELKPKLLARLPYCTFHPTTSLGPRSWGYTTHHKNKHGRTPAYAIAASFLRKRSPPISQKTHHSDQFATSSSRSARKASSDREPVAEIVSELLEVNGVQHLNTLESESADQLRSKRMTRPNPKYYGPDWQHKQVGS